MILCISSLIIKLFVVGGDDGKDKVEIGAFTEGGRDGKLGVVGEQDVFDNGQTQACADDSAAVFFVDAVVAVPNVFELFFGDAVAVVDDVDAYLVAGHRLADDDGFVVADVVDGVVDEVIEHLRHAELVAHDEYLAVVLKNDVQAVVFDQLGVARKDALDTLCQREGCFLDVGGTALQAGDIEKIGDEGVQTVGLVDDDLDVFGGHLAGQVAHDLAVAGNHRQRCAQVVGDVGDQFLLERIDLFQLACRIGQGGVQLGDLAVTSALKGNVVVLLRERLCLFVGVGDRFCDGFAEEDGDHNAEDQDDSGDDQELDSQGFDNAGNRRDLAFDNNHALAGGSVDDLGVCQYLGGLALKRGFVAVVLYLSVGQGRLGAARRLSRRGKLLFCIGAVIV